MTAPSTETMAAQLVREGATPDSAHLLAGMVLDRLAYDGNGIAIVVDAAGRPQVDEMGQPVSVVAMMDGMRRNLPQFFISTDKTKAAAPSAPAGETLTQRALREAEARRERAEAASAAGDPNPWLTGNITRQVALAARDPESAKRLRAEAGVK